MYDDLTCPLCGDQMNFTGNPIAPTEVACPRGHCRGLHHPRPTPPLLVVDDTEPVEGNGCLLLLFAVVIVVSAILLSDALLRSLGVIP